MYNADKPMKYFYALLDNSAYYPATSQDGKIYKTKTEILNITSISKWTLSYYGRDGGGKGGDGGEGITNEI